MTAARLCGLLLLAGCPSSHGFHGHVLGRAGRLDVLRIDGGAVSGAGIAPVAGARVECTGCDEPITVDAHGRFMVQLGSKNKPIQLRVRAPGFRPVELAVESVPTSSQLGYGHYVIVLAPDATTP